MSLASLDSLDPSDYLTIPNLSAPSLLSLVRALRTLAPEPRPAPVDSALERMHTDSEVLADAVDGRRREASADTLADESDLDSADDAVWIDFRDRLRGRMLYARPGFVKLSADPRQQG